MKYISIDIETTGLDRDKDQILEFGAIIEDTSKKYSFDEIPKYNAIFYYKRLSGSPFALSLNKRLLDIMCEYDKLKRTGKFVSYKNEHNIFEIADGYLEFMNSFEDFLASNGVDLYKKMTAAGKNFGSFDGQFLKNIGFFKNFNISHKSIDPATLYVDWEKDSELPSLDECKKRAGLKDVEVTHKALDDAWDVIRVIREKIK